MCDCHLDTSLGYMSFLNISREGSIIYQKNIEQFFASVISAPISVISALLVRKYQILV